MKVFRLKFDYAEYQPTAAWCARAGFGDGNEGIVILAETDKQAVEEYNRQRLPGDQINPSYLRVTEEPQVALSDTDNLIRSLSRMLENRIEAVAYLAPEQFDSQEHQEAFEKAQQDATAVLGVADAYLKAKGLA